MQAEKGAMLVDGAEGEDWEVNSSEHLSDGVVALRSLSRGGTAGRLPPQLRMPVLPPQWPLCPSVLPSELVSASCRTLLDPVTRLSLRHNNNIPRPLFLVCSWSVLLQVGE